MSFVYRGLKAEMERYIVTEHDIHHQLEHILDENPKVEHVTDRPAQLGDEVIIDYAGFCDGEQFAGGTAQHQPLTLGSGSFIPGFEEQLVGKEIGEEVIVSVTFPEVYHSEKLAGKAAEFHCKIHHIHAKSRYELNDDFAKEFGGCETMDEFKEKLTLSMQAYVDDQSEMELQNRLLLQAAESLGYEPTEEEIEKELDQQLGDLSAQLAQQGLNLEMYCQFTGGTVEKLREEARPEAEKILRAQAAISEIASLENITAAEEEIDHALEIIASQNGITLEQIKEFSAENDDLKKSVEHSVVMGKVMRLIRDAAEITIV
ncbi:MAG: trigger factor [Oscillospiraceae bacterium]|nr:trigger factor [Oscillospiraceae bacterium]